MPVKLIADLHTHTIASGHAYGTIRENAQAASEKKLKILGITEHGPGIPGTCDPFYFCNLKVVPKKLFDVQILFGCEVNVLNDGTLSLEQRWLDKLDYAIAGIHELCYTNAGKEQNTSNLINCMKHPKIKIVSHPDDDHTPLDYKRLVPAAKEYGVALELNNSSLIKKERRLNCYKNYATMLQLCERHNVPIVIDSDAHDPSGVGNFSLATKFIDETGFPEDLILNADEKRVIDFLHASTHSKNQ
ncbi:phosphatase [Anaerovibrio sp. RM50]|uniref:phosphatase n=1 Tax=Anaerovibrio sp. RM50 TaxID=1200557 RepID=UPI0004801FF0|nr:phosphatase [Anaerovibrio sp. RM50]